MNEIYDNFYGEIFGKKELIEDLISNKIKLENINENELPDEIKTINKNEREKYLKLLQKQRAENISKLKELTIKREQFISNKMKQDSTRTLFSEEIFDIIKDQAANKGVKIIDEK